DHVNVLCSVLDAANNYLSIDPAVAVPQPIFGKLDANGNFSGQLANGINFTDASDFAKAKSYECKLFGKKAISGVQHAIEIGDGSQWYHVKSGTLTAKGPIP